MPKTNAAKTASMILTFCLTLTAGKSQAADCGAKALFLFLRLENIPVDAQSIQKQLPASSANQTVSMLELCEAANQLGFGLEGVKLSGDPRYWNLPAIAYIQYESQGHFVVIRHVGRTGRLIQIIDPDREPVVVDCADILQAKEWTGYALVPKRFRLTPILVGGLVGGLGLIGLVIYQLRLRRRSSSAPVSQSPPTETTAEPSVSAAAQ